MLIEIGKLADPRTTPKAKEEALARESYTRKLEAKLLQLNRRLKMQQQAQPPRGLGQAKKQGRGRHGRPEKSPYTQQNILSRSFDSGSEYR